MNSDILNNTYNFTIFINSTGFTVCVFLFMIMLSIIYYRKRRSGVGTNPLFFSLMLFNFFPLIFEIASYASICFMPLDFSLRETFINIFLRCFIISTMFWIAIFVYYVAGLILKNVFNKMQDDDKKSLIYRVITYTIALVVCTVLGIVLPYNLLLTASDGVIYFYGAAFYVLNLELMITFVVMFVVLLLYRKKIPNAYIVPFFIDFVLFMLLMIFAIGFKYYTNNLASFLGYLTCVLFFTIESQDIQILSDYKKNMELEEISRRNKQKLLTNMSHEVRTPLYNIAGYTQFIKDNNLSDEEKKNYLKNINTSTLVLKNILQNILDVASIQTDKNIVKLNNYYAKDLYLKVNQFAVLNKKDNVVFTFNYDHDIPCLLSSDYDKLYRIITNILLNAYSCVDYGEVSLNIDGKKIDSQYYEITYKISNSGHVMKQEEFELNIQDYISKTKKIDYVMLGIIIAREFVEKLGGNIEFINEKGKGTQYIVKLKEKVIDDTAIGNII